MKEEVAESILKWEDNEECDFYEVVEGTEETIEDQRRWHTTFSSVYRDTRDGTFWKVYWDRGSTEYQDEGVQNIQIEMVQPRIVERIEYVRVGS